MFCLWDVQKIFSKLAFFHQMTRFHTALRLIFCEIVAAGAYRNSNLVWTVLGSWIGHICLRCRARMGKMRRGTPDSPLPRMSLTHLCYLGPMNPSRLAPRSKRSWGKSHIARFGIGCPGGSLYITGSQGWSQSSCGSWQTNCMWKTLLPRRRCGATTVLSI